MQNEIIQTWRDLLFPRYMTTLW